MSSNFGYIDIILLAMIAGFIILRLRSILGRKTGHEDKIYPRFSEKQFEELVQDSETIRKTLHDKIFEIRPTLTEDIVKSITKRILGNELSGNEFNNNELRVTLANLVPEYTPLDKDSTDPIVLNVKPEIEA